MLIAALLALGLLAAMIHDPAADWRRFELLLLGLAIPLVLLIRQRASLPRWTLGAALLGALIIRLALIPQAPSSDVHRYLWEGKLQLAGGNPYRTPPSDPTLVQLRGPDHEKINHPDWTAIYGPLAEGLFAVVAWTWPTILGWKLLCLLTEILLLWLLWRLLLRRGLSPVWLLAYAWHPLVLWSVPGAGHLEVLVAVGVLGMLLALETERPALAGLALAAAVLIKPTALVFAPLLFWTRPRWPALGLLLVVLPLGYLPYADAGSGLFASLWRFGSEMSFNSLPPFIRLPLLPLGLFWVVRREREPAGRALLLAGLFLLASPTVHPWYALTLVPLACLAGSTPWWVLSLTLILAGETRAIEVATGAWDEPGWTRWAVYGPFLLATCAGALTAWARGSAESGPQQLPRQEGRLWTGAPESER